jgi:hypothetical protein
MMFLTSLGRRVAGPLVRLGLAAVLGWIGPSGVRAQAPAYATPAPRYATPAYRGYGNDSRQNGPFDLNV